MGKRFTELSDQHIRFIVKQKMFFVGTAAAEGQVNVSPKGMDTLRVLGQNRVVWLNVTGSGNESAAHVQQNPRMTIMFCAFDGLPLILRLYGTARIIHPRDAEWGELAALFPPLPAMRQIFDLKVELVQTSCGEAVPLYDYVGDRDNLNEWAINKGEDGIHKYWEEKNQVSLDGFETHLLG